MRWGKYSALRRGGGFALAFGTKLDMMAIRGPFLFAKFEFGTWYVTPS
jgi:hypothetical protein